jgi:hypothetical protein
MRYAEIALLLVPVALAAAWICGIRGLSRRGLVASCLVLLTMAAALYWFGAGRAVQGHYVPAHIVNGRIVPGHGR